MRLASGRRTGLRVFPVSGAQQTTYEDQGEGVERTSNIPHTRPQPDHRTRNLLLRLPSDIARDQADAEHEGRLVRAGEVVADEPGDVGVLGREKEAERSADCGKHEEHADERTAIFGESVVEVGAAGRSDMACEDGERTHPRPI